MSAAFEKTIKIKFDTSDLPKGERAVVQTMDNIAKRGMSVSAANDNLRGTFASMGTSMSSAANDGNKLGSSLSALKSNSSAASTGLRSVGSAAKEANGGLLEMIGHVGKVTLAIAGLTFLVEGIHEIADAFVEASNQATEVASRLAVVTTSTQGLAQAQKDVLSISTQTRSAMTDTAELYQKIGIQADHLKLSQQGVSTATKTFAETLKISGATQQQAQGSMRQLGEAFDIGTLSGVHYKAMMSDNIVFMRLLAQSMGVPMGTLKELSTQGKVTAADLKKALTDPKLTDDIQKRFDRMPVSFADARLAIHNTLIQLAGDFGKGAGLNDALKSLYVSIANFGQTAGPAFEKIGVAARAAFSAIAPAAQAAWAAIKPVFSFVLDNAPALISLLKVAAESWLAYKAATLAVSAVNLAGSLATEVQFLGLVIKEVITGASAFSELGKALKAATGAQTLFNAVAELNPYVALATAIVAVVGLLYEFRDAIGLGGGTMATLGDLFRAVWADIKSGVGAAINAVTSAFSSMWNGIKSAVSAVGDFLANAFSLPLNSIEDMFSSTFGDLDFSIAGVLVGAARVADGLIGLFRGSVNAIGVLFEELPSTIYQSLSPTLQGIVDQAGKLVVGIGSGIASVFNAVVGFGQSAVSVISSVFNAVSSFIATWVNKAISAINTVIGAANKLGAGIEQVASVKLAQITAPKAEATGWTKLGHDVGAAFNSGFGHEAENSVKGLLAQASTIGAARRAAGVHTGAGASTAAPGLAEGDASGSGKRDKDAERRAKREKEFWDQLKGEVETAKLLPLAAEDYKKQLELQKIVGHDISAQDKARIADLDQQARTAKYLTDALDQHNKSQRDINSQQELFQDKLKGLTDSQLATEKSVLTFRTNALAQGVDIQGQAYKLAEDQLRADQARLGAINDNNKALEDGLTLAEKYSRSYQTYKANKDFDQQRKDLNTAYNGGSNDVGLTKKVHDEILDGINKASKEASLKFADDFSDKINDIANDFGGKFGKILSGIGSLIQSLKNASTGNFSGLGKVGGLLTLFGKNSDGTLNKFGQAAADASDKTLKDLFSSKTWQDPLKSMSDGFKDFKGSFSSANGGFVKGLGKAIGNAGIGVQIGDKVNSVLAPLGKALGFKTSKLGSEIGGGLGSIFGPVGSVIGSFAGGIIGGLFKKAQQGGTSVSIDSLGNVAAGHSFGNNSKAITASDGAAGNVASSLNQIAQQLGGVISGNPMLNIGTYDGKWRVNTTGSTKLGGGGGKYGNVDFGKDGEADAIAYAIQQALKQGILTGISDFSERILQSGADIDEAVSLATQYEKVLSNLAAWKDPVKNAADQINKSFDTLVAGMKKAGATSSELGNVEEERAHELQEALKQQVSGFQDILDQLNGDAGGATSLSQLQDELKSLAGYKADVAAGKSINQDDFDTLAGKIIQNAGNVYDPNSSAYQDIVSSLKAIANGAISLATADFNSGTSSTDTATSQAINSQTDAITAQQAITNDYLAQLVAQGNKGVTTAVKSGGAVNGRQPVRY